MPAIYLNDKVRISINRSTWVVSTKNVSKESGKEYWKDEKHLMSLQSAIANVQQMGYVDGKSDQADDLRTIAQVADDTLCFAEQGLGYIHQLYAYAQKGLDQTWSEIMDGPTLSQLTDKQLEEMLKTSGDDAEVMQLLQCESTVRTVKNLSAGIRESLTRASG